MHVFLFSDHVSERDEVELKRRGAELGLLVMGPGCGTAMLGEVGLGFANVVRSGSVGIVAAAGTGAQEAASLLDGADVGVSQIVGVGGRDLSKEVGGIMFGEAMRMLAADDGTDTLLLVSKPPVARGRAEARRGRRQRQAGRRRVRRLGGAATRRSRSTRRSTRARSRRPASPRRTIADLEALVDEQRVGGKLLGLYSGGSLAHEAETILGHGHTILDLGEEEYTQGRPHPMVDLGVRLEHARARSTTSVGCLLLDVVIGHGSHPDPAGELAPGAASELQDPR